MDKPNVVRQIGRFVFYDNGTYQSYGSSIGNKSNKRFIHPSTEHYSKYKIDKEAAFFQHYYMENDWCIFHELDQSEINELKFYLTLNNLIEGDNQK